MNLGLLNTLVPSLTHGVERGVQQEIDGARLFVFAVQHNDKAMLNEIVAVLNQQISEGADAAGLVKGNVVAALLTGSDPFAGSRKMLQDLEARHGVTHDAKGNLVLPK